MSLKKIALMDSLVLASHVHADPVPAAGTLVIVAAFGEVTRADDAATASFMIEEQDKDKAAAASRVNQKMKQSTDIVRRDDPTASLKTLGYYAYPVYPEERPLPNGMPSGGGAPETVDFVGAGNDVETIAAQDAGAPQMMRTMKAQPEVVEPSFEPGETTLQMRLMGKVRFK